MPDIMMSVVICTRNRAGKLKNALASLDRMSVPQGLTWEVIVVDNNSTDGTKKLVDCFANTGRLPVIYVFEGRRGVSHARNKAIEIAQGEIIASIDDDCLVDRDWITNIDAAFRTDPKLGVMGGRVELFNKDDKPITIRTTLFEYSVTTPSQIFGSIVGCNIAYRREIAKKIGGFDPRFGPGATVPAAEDPDFLYRALKSQSQLAYLPDALVFHDHGRRTEKDVRALEDAYLIGRGGFYCKFMIKGDFIIAKMTYWEIRGLCVNIIKRMARRQSASYDFHTLKALVRGAALYIRTGLQPSTR